MNSIANRRPPAATGWVCGTFASVCARLYENRARVDTTAASDHFVVELEMPCAEHP